MAELPFMQFFPADHLRDTEILSLSAQGGWMRMLCSMWHPSRRGVLGLRLQAMARLLHASEQTTKSIIDEIEECCVGLVEWSDDGERVTVTCRRIVRDWGKAVAEKHTLVDAGKRGAAKRWGNREDNSPPNGQPINDPNSPPNGNPDTRSQSTDREKNKGGVGIRRPSLADAKNAAPGIGVTPEKADEWWHTREASAWMKGTVGGGTTPVGTNWQADLKIYASRPGFSPPKADHRKAKAYEEYPEPPRRPLPRA